MSEQKLKELKADAKQLIDYLQEQEGIMYEIDDTALAVPREAWHSIVHMARKLCEGETSTYIQVLQETISKTRSSRYSDLLSFLDGKILNCEQMLSSQGIIDKDTRLRLEGETASLKDLRIMLKQWSSIDTVAKQEGEKK